MRPSLEGIVTIEATIDQLCALLSAVDIATIQLEKWLNGLSGEVASEKARKQTRKLLEDYKKLHDMLEQTYKGILSEEVTDDGEERGANA